MVSYSNATDSTGSEWVSVRIGNSSATTGTSDYYFGFDNSSLTMNVDFGTTTIGTPRSTDTFRWTSSYTGTYTTDGTENVTLYLDQTGASYYSLRSTHSGYVVISNTRNDAAWEKYRKEQARKDRLNELRIKFAENKANVLLGELIGDKELEVYKETGKLMVRGREHDYIINRDGLLHKIDKDKIVELCVGIEDKWNYPKTDNVVALKLMLEANEDAILKMANRRGERKLVLPEKLAISPYIR